MSRRQDFAWRVEAGAFAAYSALMRLLPVDWVSAFGAALLKTLGPLSGSHRTAERNLRLAFPDMADAERRRLLKAQWDNLGRTFAEFPIMDRITPATGRVEIVNGERFAQIVASGRPVVFISGHFANWEVMAAAMMHAGVKAQVTYRAANNPYFDRAVRESRARYGIKLFAPKGAEGARELLEGMRRGESVALMNDQKFNEGVSVPFFGRQVMAAPGPSRLALRFGADIQPLSVERVKGARFRVIVHEPIRLEATADRNADIEEGVRRITAFVERRVRERPQEWFWVHKRWPNEAYAELKAQGL